MKSLNAKISFIVIFFISCTLTLTAFAYKNFQAIEEIENNIYFSLNLRDLTQKLSEQRKPSDKIIHKLRKSKKNLFPKYRADAMSDLVQSLYSNNRRLRRKRFKEFKASEKKYFKAAVRQNSVYRRRFKRYTFFAVLTPLIGLLVFSLYIKRSIIKPLQRLSQRMMDFLVDRYTFKFSRPVDNEIGDLQRTFNSLAQRVLNNMDELKALDQAKSEFVSIASHELRTPLTSIKGSLGLLSTGVMGEIPKEATDLVDIAENETDRLVRLINDMLDIAKMESRSFTLSKAWVTAHELCNKTAKSIQGLAQAAKVSLVVTSDSDKVLEVLADEDRIQQVITNLTSNAIKYSPVKSTVTIKYSVTSKGHLKVGITDSGPGIDQKDQALIFEKFRQGKKTSNQLVKGTGLGLAISKALVEEHGGTIGVTSTLGEGSTFYFTLPKWREGNQQTAGNLREVA